MVYSQGAQVQQKSPMIFVVPNSGQKQEVTAAKDYNDDHDSNDVQNYDNTAIFPYKTLGVEAAPAGEQWGAEETHHDIKVPNQRRYKGKNWPALHCQILKSYTFKFFIFFI